MTPPSTPRERVREERGKLDWTLADFRHIAKNRKKEMNTDDLHNVLDILKSLFLGKNCRCRKKPRHRRRKGHNLLISRIVQHPYLTFYEAIKIVGVVKSCATNGGKDITC